MSNLFSEDAFIKQPAIRLFKDVLGWQTVNAYAETYGENGSLGREHRGEVVLISRPCSALEKPNQTLPSVAIELAITELTRDRSTFCSPPIRMCINSSRMRKEFSAKISPGETFRVLKEKEIKQFGEYRTRRLVLEAWNRLVG